MVVYSKYWRKLWHESPDFTPKGDMTEKMNAIQKPPGDVFSGGLF